MADPRKLGKLPPRVDLRTLKMKKYILPTPPPPAVYWSKGYPAWSMMLNDTLGDCTCAAFYHALQVWSYNTTEGAMVTQPDADVEKLYILACGYNPRVGGEGPGGNEQKLLTYILRTGAPTGPTGQTANKLTAFVEVDPRNIDDVKRAILNCGVAYIGFNVPQFIVPAPPATPPAVWNVQTTNTNIVGGHAVVLAGYNAQGARVISWGQYYTMTWAFFSQYVDEVYALADSTWIEAKGTTPGGLTLAELQSQMQALAEKK